MWVHIITMLLRDAIIFLIVQCLQEEDQYCLTFQCNLFVFSCINNNVLYVIFLRRSVKERVVKAQR